MKYPCIRNLDPFRKKGCPQKLWDGKEGCPCWIEKVVPIKEGEKTIIKQCVDLWMFKLHWDANCLLEGNQQAVESFRNGMVEVDNNGKVQPKPDPATILLINLIKDMQQRQIE